MTFSKAKAAFGLALAGIMACAFLLVGCGGSSDSDSNKDSNQSQQSSSSQSSNSNSSAQQGQAISYMADVAPDNKYGKGIHHATLTIEGYEPVTIELNADEAPVTVANFANLVNQGFYDGLNFYRFVDGFCMQGGSSNNSVAATNDGITPIVGEFSSNGRDNALADNFQKGTVAMARSSAPNSAGSTFFVTLGSDANVGASLNGQYAAFGTIDVNGMAVIDQVVADYLPNVTDTQMGSISDTSKQAKITSIKMVD